MVALMHHYNNDIPFKFSKIYPKNFQILKYFLIKFCLIIPLLKNVSTFQGVEALMKPFPSSSILQSLMMN